jgi:cytochrome c oxidase cbb3-type subunit 3
MPGGVWIHCFEIPDMRYCKTCKVWIFLILLLLALLMVGNVSAHGAKPQNSKNIDALEEVRSAYKQSQVRGALVYKNYCVVCHGEIGDGRARGAKLYGADKLVIKQNSDKYYETIVRLGGEETGKSPFMPVWKDELTEEQIGDVVDYLHVISDPVGRGQAVFNANCILCHGIRGDGKGRASVLYNPPPSDLTRSNKNRDYKKMIITFGGTALGRSQVMPKWGEQLSEQQIQDVVDYLDTLKATR